MLKHTYNTYAPFYNRVSNIKIILFGSNNIFFLPSNKEAVINNMGKLVNKIKARLDIIYAHQNNIIARLSNIQLHENKITGRNDFMNVGQNKINAGTDNISVDTNNICEHRNKISTHLNNIYMGINKIKEGKKIITTHFLLKKRV